MLSKHQRKHEPLPRARDVFRCPCFPRAPLLPVTKRQLIPSPPPSICICFLFRFTKKDKHLGRDFIVGPFLLVPSATARNSDSVSFAFAGRKEELHLEVWRKKKKKKKRFSTFSVKSDHAKLQPLSSEPFINQQFPVSPTLRRSDLAVRRAAAGWHERFRLKRLRFLNGYTLGGQWCVSMETRMAWH